MNEPSAAPAGKSSWHLAPGDEVAPGCLVVASLGGGRRFEVFSAFDTRMLAKVVVKVLRPDARERPRTLAAVRREIGILERLDHPHIVRCFHATAQGDRPYLALERAAGRTLTAAVKRGGPRDPSEAVSIGLALASSAHYLSEQGVIHLDIKPSNVILAAPVRLIDFSLAREVDQVRDLTVPVGTTAWMAPEQCDPVGRGGPTSASDVWGVGATIYYAVSGRRPFPAAADDGSMEERYPQLTTVPRPLPDATPAALGELVMSMLHREPKDRPSAREAHRRLSELSHEYAQRG